MDVLKWIGSNYDGILISLGALLAAAAAIAKLTPSEKDDKAVSKISGYVSKIMEFLKINKKK